MIGSLVKRKHISINTESTLRKAIEKMAAENIDVLPVLSKENGHVIGILSYKNIISSYKHGIDEHTKKRPDISLKRRGLKILIRGQKIINILKTKEQVS